MNRSSIGITAVLVLFYSMLAFADVRYVSKTGTGSPPYMSWETAADSIQKCLNISDNGDTIYVANGIYHDSLVVNKSITLIGMSMDSTVIDGAGYRTTINVPFNTTFFRIKNFKILGKGYNDGIPVFCVGAIDMSYCLLTNAKHAIFHKGGYVKNVIIRNAMFAISGGCPYDTCHYNIEDNIIVQNIENSFGIDLSIGGHYIIKNNILIFYENNNPAAGISTTISGIRTLYAYNNLISGYNDAFYINIQDTAFLYNNVITNCSYAFSVYKKTNMRNNIISNTLTAFWSGSVGGSPINDYNLIWNYFKIYGNNTFPGENNIVAYPMFVKDKKPDPSLDFDFHLQKYSPAIDRGDPSILDADGTRSDLGLYGGPYGQIYGYKDYPPLQPKNLTALVSSNEIKTRWRKNPEADTSFYSVYMDTVINFTIDSTKLLGNTSDTLFTFSSALVNKPYYFKVTATDKQGNQSLPSEELRVFISSTETEEPKVISSYQLYHNYPNPFNPSTIISYKLKERGNVKLQVYDIKGEMVKILVNKEQEAGYYETVFDATELASGMYIYKIEVTGNGNIPVYTEMKKCSLVK